DLDDLLAAREPIADGAVTDVRVATPGPTDGVDRVKLTGLRRSIARHMEQSAEHIPHFTYVEEVDVTELQRLRRSLDREWAAGDDHDEGPSVLTLVMRAVVLAVRDHPEMNARFDDGAGVVERHRAVHL